MGFHESSSKGAKIIEIGGVFDPLTYDRLAMRLQSLPEDSHRVVLDFSRVNGINPGSVVQLATLSTMLLAKHARLILCCLNDECLQAVRKNDPSMALLIAESQEHALSAPIKALRAPKAG